MSIEEYEDNECEKSGPLQESVSFVQRLGSLLAGGFVVIGALGAELSVTQTMGANVQSFLGKNGKPILMELRNCRVVEPSAPPRILAKKPFQEFR